MVFKRFKFTAITVLMSSLLIIGAHSSFIGANIYAAVSETIFTPSYAITVKILRRVNNKIFYIPMYLRKLLILIFINK